MTIRYTDLYAFGDSLSDAGNDSIGTLGVLPVAPPYYQTSYGPLGTFNAAVFSNGPLTLAGAKVHGSARSAQGSVMLKAGSLVTGDVTAGTTISKH